MFKRGDRVKAIYGPEAGRSGEFLSGMPNGVLCAVLFDGDIVRTLTTTAFLEAA